MTLICRDHARNPCELRETRFTILLPTGAADPLVWSTRMMHDVTLLSICISLTIIYILYKQTIGDAVSYPSSHNQRVTGLERTHPFPHVHDSVVESNAAMENGPSSSGKDSHIQGQSHSCRTPINTIYQPLQHYRN